MREEFVKFAGTFAVAIVSGLALVGTVAVAQESPKFEVDARWLGA
jgi:hypothetical protein